MMGYVHYVVGKNTFLVQFKDGQKKEMSYSSLVFLSLNEQVNMDDPLANLTHNYKGVEGEESNQYKDWGGVCCKVKVWIDVG